MSLRSEVIRIVNELLGNSKKISELPAASALTGSEQVELNQSGTSARTTAQAIANLGGGGGGAVSSVFTRTGAVIAQTGDYTVAQVTGAAPLTLTLNPQVTDYTLQLTDQTTLTEVVMNVGIANTLTVPPNASVAFPVGTQILVRQTGAGLTTFVQGAGVTITPSSGGSYNARPKLFSAPDKNRHKYMEP